MNRAKTLAALLFFAAGMSACGNKESKPGQALVRVNGEEITVSQLNEELQRANVQAPQQEAASKQLIESLVDRQLLVNEALQDKLDRDPKVVQAIERAKALIIAQSYLQKKLGPPTKPSAADVEAYFNQHPEFFTNRKQFDMNELVFATKDMNDTLKSVIDGAKSLEEVASWMEQHKVAFGRTQISRTSADLPSELVSKLVGMPRGQLFIIKEGERSLLVVISEIKDAPVKLAAAANQIEQYLVNKKNKDAADAELARLRGKAKIEYLNGRQPPEKVTASASASALTQAPAEAAQAPAVGGTDKPDVKSDDAATARGVTGLK